MLLPILIAFVLPLTAHQIDYEERYINMENYLSEFPFDEYDIVTIPFIGSFYLDRIDDAIKNVLRNKIPWENHLVKLMQKIVRQGQTVVDVGAHIGTHTIHLAKCVGPKGKIFAFEPQLKLFRELYMNCALNKLHNTCLMRYAIGSKNKPIMMGNPPVGNEGGVGVSRGGDEADQYTLDSLKLPPFSFIKIDVEGGENQLLDGATKTLLKYKPIILIEIMGGHDVDTACPEIKERIFSTHRKLERLGYTISRVSVQDYLARPK